MSLVNGGSFLYLASKALVANLTTNRYYVDSHKGMTPSVASYFHYVPGIFSHFLAGRRD